MFRILIAIGQTPFDPTSGAAQATLHLAELLALGGIEVCCLTTSGVEGFFAGSLPEGKFSLNGVKYHIIPVDPKRKHSWHHIVGKEYDQRYDLLLTQFNPHFVFTFGNEPPDQSRRERAVAAGSKVIFCIHNESYRANTPKNVTCFLCPSDYLKNVYLKAWDDEISIAVLPTPMMPKRIVSDSWEPVFVTFINPQPTKGLWFMIRLAEQLASHHPDIPFRIIEGRATAADFLTASRKLGINLSMAENLFFSPCTADIREVWATTRILLAPALWNEPAGRTPIEAMMNGAVPLVSNRGGLAEQVQFAEFILPVPDHITAISKSLPTAAEVAHWLQRIVHLCEDEEAFQRASDLARAGSERFSEKALAPLYMQFLRELGARDLSSAGGSA